MADELPGIRKEYEPSGKEADVLKNLYRRYYEMKDNSRRTELERRWDLAMKNWEAFRPEKKETDWQSNYFIPLTTSVIESILSEMVDQTPRPIILPRSSEDKARAMVMQHIFNFTWEIADGDIELYNWLKNTLIFGTGIVQEYYFQDRRKVLLPDRMGKNDRIEYKEQEILEFDGSFMENVSPYDIYVDEKARDFNRGSYKARDVIRRYVMDIDAFHDFFSGKVWDPFGNAKYVKPGGDTNYYEYFKPPESDYKANDVEVLWRWARRPEDACEIVANDVLIKMGPNPYRHKQLPFSRAVDVVRPHQFYGKGEPELLESIQDELNTFRRMGIDRGKLDLDKMFLVSNRETLDDRDLMARPHGMIPVDDPKSVQPVEYGDVPRSVQLIQDEINKDAIKVTGIEDRFQSISSPSTATEAAILKESVIRRVRMKLRMFEKGGLVDVGRMRVANIIQFYSQPELERIIGDAESQKYRSQVNQASRNGTLEVKNGKAYQKKYNTIRIPGKRIISDENGKLMEESIRDVSFFEATPDTFVPMAKGGFDVRFEAGSTMPVSKPLMQTKAQEMFDRLMQVADIVGYDPTKLADNYVETLDKNPEDFKKQEQGVETADAQKGNIVEAAILENKMIEQGQTDGVPEHGTPYAPPTHTELHIALLRSPKIDTKKPEFQFLLKHAMGEILAQEHRQEAQAGGSQQAGVPVPPAPSGGETGSAPNLNKQMQNMMPNRIQGGGQVPEQPGSRGLLAGVANFFRGGA